MSANVQRGSTLLEFALAWPVALLLVLGAIQLGVYSVEVNAARAAALAGARAAATRGGTISQGTLVAVLALDPALVGVQATSYCQGGRGGPRNAPPVSVCTRTSAGLVSVVVSGKVPSLVPLVGPQLALPIYANAVVHSEVFTP